MICLLLASLAPEPRIDRDSYGVPKVTAPDWDSGFRGMGRAVAQDRLWQMEMARRMSRGRLSEVLPDAINSDIEILQTCYTDDELKAQIEALPSDIQATFRAYAHGVNDVIQARTAEGTLPPGYAQNNFKPEPWTILDSAAVAVQLTRQFGKGGAGEIRAMALLKYLQTAPAKEQAFDVLDDLAWHNDPKSVPTLDPSDDKYSSPFPPAPTRVQTLAHYQKLPEVSLLELLPAIMRVEGRETELIAEKVKVANRWGSYAVAVQGKRSRTGNAHLLTAPQMGHSTPSVVHECALSFPGMEARGISIPGVPGIVIGSTPRIAWGLTTGAADVEDIYVSQSGTGDSYLYDGKEKDLEVIHFSIARKGSAGLRGVTQRRTHAGPVILTSRSGKHLFSLRSALWKKELSFGAGLFGLQRATSASAALSALDSAAPCFNVFVAFPNGDIGWRFAGKIPVRPAGWDARLPLPLQPDTEWKGFLTPSQMPRVINPKSGLIANWNNKPTTWWPNGDTPVWGQFFRNDVLLRSLPAGPLGRTDLETAAWEIARRDSRGSAAFQDLYRSFGEGPVKTWDGWMMQGSASAAHYEASVRSLRRLLFRDKVGNLTGEGLFEQALQPALIWRALEGRTKVNYLAGRTLANLVKQSSELAAADLLKTQPFSELWSYQPGQINVPGETPIPYADRGTFIMISELGKTIASRSVQSPGAAESGVHSRDQAALARGWHYKAVWPY